MRPRDGFTFRDLLVAVGLLGVLAALLFPAAQSAREAARRNSCVCHGKQITLSVHNFHDVFKRLPNSTSKRLRGSRPGCARPTDDAEPAGFSWQVKILPYLEETHLFNQISEASHGFRKPAFDTNMVRAVADSSGRVEHFSRISMNAWQCPSYSGPRYSTAPEYASIGGTAVSTYVALAATDFRRVLDTDAENLANGVLAPAPQHLCFDDITDGISRTLMWAESRESGYTSWYDGTVAWNVGADPNGLPPETDDNDYLLAKSSSALTIGPGGNGAHPYLPKQLHGSIEQDWNWGPSSEHAAGVVTHGVADGSVRVLATDIDPTLYIQIISRAGKEPAVFPE